MPRTVAGAKAGSEERSGYVIEAVDRALNLLELLAANPDLGVTEIAKQMQVSKTLAFRLLHTLERRGYIVRDEARRANSLGYRVLYLAGNVNRHNLLVATTKPLLDELAKLCDEDVNLFVRIGLNAVCMAARSSVHQVRIFPEVGLRLSMHAGAASPLLLAYAPEEVQEAVLSRPLEAFTSATVVDPAKIRQRLRRMRKQGFHISRGDVDVAAFSIAAPIFGHDGKIAASICISGAINRLTPEIAERHRLMVVDYAGRMSERLGAIAAN
ncbi:IclR family transcriptional regulator [Aliihoeflea sp. 40Bstr573]|uniref:IclR family transcriptional regulator n=1 Tax=Aliihoeflea sp. 40Bstr573 TaxID=2696467 RepID=UPI0020944552|nr:IclR family transcriptional regulator [Aliihoeflea sp. 40Bstr573]MCO6386971.1 helix-turn-helix domain-containing protein [Aliihoeflea sp. 40Bstr573]